MHAYLIKLLLIEQIFYVIMIIVKINLYFVQEVRHHVI